MLSQTHSEVAGLQKQVDNQRALTKKGETYSVVIWEKWGLRKTCEGGKKTEIYRICVFTSDSTWKAGQYSKKSSSDLFFLNHLLAAMG